MSCSGWVLEHALRGRLGRSFAMRHRRHLRFMGKDTVWKERQVGWALSALSAFPVTRGTSDREALRRVIAVLEVGPPTRCAGGRRLSRTVYRRHSEQLHAELQRLFDLAVERVPWSYPFNGNTSDLLER